MPMIQVKVTTPLTAEQNVKIHNELTSAVVKIFRKPVEYVMVNEASPITVGKPA